MAVFENLQCSKSYYPMIALNRPSAFYGLPPQPMCPTRLFASMNVAERDYPTQQQCGPVLPSEIINQSGNIPFQLSAPPPQPHQASYKGQSFNVSEKRCAEDAQDQNGDGHSKKLKISQVIDGPAR